MNTTPQDNFDKALKEAHDAIDRIHAIGPLPPVHGISDSYDPVNHSRDIATVKHFLLHLEKLVNDLRSEER